MTKCVISWCYVSGNKVILWYEILVTQPVTMQSDTKLKSEIRKECWPFLLAVPAAEASSHTQNRVLPLSSNLHGPTPGWSPGSLTSAQSFSSIHPLNPKAHTEAVVTDITEPRWQGEAWWWKFSQWQSPSSNHLPAVPTTAAGDDSSDGSSARWARSSSSHRPTGLQQVRQDFSKSDYIGATQ